eukprot:scaffold100203_cov58-Phaeocystis_antarctica.AAC.4
MRKNISTNGPNWGETSSTRMTRSQRRKTATARKDVAVASSLSPVDMNAMSAANEKKIGHEAVVHTRRPRLRVAAGGHELAGLPQEPASDPDEQQRRDRRSDEVGCRDEREREGEGQVSGALEAELDDGETQDVIFPKLLGQPGLQGWHQRHEREDDEQLPQEENQEQWTQNMIAVVDSKLVKKLATPSDDDVLLHHRLRQQLLGLDLDSMLESLATVLAVKQLLHILLATGLPGLIVLDARGSRQLQPCEEGLVVVGGARVAGAQRAGTGSCGSRQADQIEHCRRRCQHLSRHITLSITSLRQVPVGLGRRHPTQMILINAGKPQ